MKQGMTAQDFIRLAMAPHGGKRDIIWLRLEATPRNLPAGHDGRDRFPCGKEEATSKI